MNAIFSLHCFLILFIRLFLTKVIHSGFFSVILVMNRTIHNHKQHLCLGASGHTLRESVCALCLLTECSAACKLSFEERIWQDRLTGDFSSSLSIYPHCSPPLEERTILIYYESRSTIVLIVYIIGIPQPEGLAHQLWFKDSRHRGQQTPGVYPLFEICDEKGTLCDSIPSKICWCHFLPVLAHFVILYSCPKTPEASSTLMNNYLFGSQFSRLDSQNCMALSLTELFLVS